MIRYIMEKFDRIGTTEAFASDILFNGLVMGLSWEYNGYYNKSSHPPFILNISPETMVRRKDFTDIWDWCLGQ